MSSEVDTASHNFRNEPFKLTIVSSKRVQLEWEEERSKYNHHSKSTLPKLKLFFFFSSRLPEITYCHSFFFFRNSFLVFLLECWCGRLVWICFLHERNRSVTFLKICLGLSLLLHFCADGLGLDTS